MNLIARNTDYAIRSLSFIAKHSKEVVSVRDLVRELRIPRPFLRKILQDLSSAGILNSFKGKGGGFRLAKMPGKISLTEVIETFQGPIKLQEHFFKKGTCKNMKTCVLKKRLDAIEKDVIVKLSAISIASIM